MRSTTTTTGTSRGRRVLTAALALLSLAYLGCTRPQASEPAREDELVVFAAASLRDAFSTLAKDFERAHPGTELKLNFAGTQQLRTQLEHGAAADVLASADQAHMDALARASLVSTPVVFARNEAVLVVTRERADEIRSLADLPAASRIVVGAPEVPIGRYTLQILARASAALGDDFRARVEARVASRELNVRQVLAKVSLGEAEAGFVYRTDVARSDEGPLHERVRVVDIPQPMNVIANYPIAVVTGAPHPDLAQAWIDFVLSSQGQRSLERAGFLPPPAASGAAP